METITRHPTPMTPQGNPQTFYPYSTFVSSKRSEPEGTRQPGDVRPDAKAADLSKFKPATVEKKPLPAAAISAPEKPAAPARIKKPWEK